MQVLCGIQNNKLTVNFPDYVFFRAIGEIYFPITTRGILKAIHDTTSQRKSPTNAEISPPKLRIPNKTGNFQICQNELFMRDFFLRCKC